MADEIAQPVVTAPVEIAPAPVPVVETVVAAPVPEVAPVPVVEAAPVTEAKTADEVTAETPTLLQEVKDEPKKEEAKPAEAKVEGEKTEAEPPIEAALEPIKYELNFPETLAADDTVKAEVSELFNEGRITPEHGQKLVDFYDKKAAEYRDYLQREQVNVFNKMRADWRTEVKKDPELGGAGYDTTIAAIARVRDKLVPASERKAFNDFCIYTGAGDHPAFLKMLHRAAAILDEPPPRAPDPKPVPQGRQPGQRRSAVLYGDAKT